MNASSKQPTILQVLPSLRSGGVERGTIEIADAIQKHGWNALVASSGGPMVDQLRAKKVEHIELPLKSKNPFTIWSNSKRLAALIKERNISLIHARSRAPAWSARWAANKAGIPFVTTYHGTYGNKNLFKRFYNSVMAKGDKVIAISQFIHDYIHEHHQTTPEKITTIPRGADLSYFDSEHVDGNILMSLAETWSLPENCPPLILLPGRITRWKGQHVLIEALAKLKEENWIAVIMGDAKDGERYMEELYSLIKHYQLEERIRFAPNTQHMREAYTLSDIVLCPSTAPEAFGRIPVEAQAMGKPIIATAHGGATETVINEETGILVPASDAEALATAIKKLLSSSKDTLKEMKQTARENVQKHFTTQNMQKKTLALYEECLNG